MKLESRRELVFASSKRWRTSRPPSKRWADIAGSQLRHCGAIVIESAEECLRPGSDRVAMRFEDAQEIVYLD